jgi:hypothetical protein
MVNTISRRWPRFQGSFHQGVRGAIPGAVSAVRGNVQRIRDLGERIGLNGLLSIIRLRNLATAEGDTPD